MIIPVGVLLLFLTVPLSGGRIGRLGALPLRWSSAVAIALAIQIVVTVGTVTPGIGAGLHLVSYAFAAAFVVANRRIPGMLLTASGGSMNLAAIAANGGVMPASPRAMEIAGISATGEHFVNSGAVEGARLAWLGDVFAIPAAWPLSNVFSVGDVVLLVGVAILMHRACHTAPARPVTDAIVGQPWGCRIEMVPTTR